MRLGLRSKLILLFVLLAIIPSLMVGFLSYRISYNALWNNTVHSSMQIADQLNASIESLFKDTEQFFDIGKSDYVYNYILGKGDSYENAKQILALFDIYRRNFPFSNSVESIYIFGTNGRAISERKGVYKFDDLEQSAKKLAEQFENERSTKIITGNIHVKTLERSAEYIYIGQTLSLPALRDPFCTVIVELNSNTIESFCDSVDIAGSGYFTIFDEAGHVIFGRSYDSAADQKAVFDVAKEQERGSYVGKLNEKNAFILYNTAPRTMWKIVGQVQMSDLMSEAQDIAKTTFTAVLLIMVFAIVLYLFFTSRLIKPLRNLKAMMKIAAMGDMSIRFKAGTNDEISDLGKNFNRMIEQIDMLVKQNLREQLSLRKSEFKLLQAQINPHFLYNTLDTILWQAQAGKTKDVANMVNALSRFFRTTLSKGNDWIDVNAEINLIKDYLTIQSLRYSDLLRFEICVSEDILNYPMLKLTLQPLVENALYHGIKNKRGGGKILVAGYRENDALVFTIEDDGAGISEGQLTLIACELEQMPHCIEIVGEGGFGLKNVNSRIKLYYGEPFGIALSARKGGGLVVTVRLGLEAGNV